MSAQLALDGRDSRVKVVNQSGYGSDWWGAKCADCGAWLTKYDHSEHEAYVLALAGLIRGRHACPGGPVPEREGDA